MIDWVHAELEPWGRQMRWLHFGKDGWPSRTILGKLMDEGVVGASASKWIQHFPEVLQGDAVRVNSIFQRCPAWARDMLVVHYVIHGKGKVKAHRLGLPVRTYYDHVDRAHRAYANAAHSLHKIVPIRAAQRDEERVAFPIPLAHSA